MLVGVGLALGVLCAVLSARAMRAWLYETAPTDPLTLNRCAARLRARLLRGLHIARVARQAAGIPARRCASSDEGCRASRVRSVPNTTAT